MLGTWTNEVYYYDALGRVVFQYLPHSSNTIGYRTWSYDAPGRVTAERLYQTSGTLDRSTTLTYAGRTTSITDPLSRTRSQVHDVLGRLRRVIDPSPGGTTSYNYDAFGNLNRVQDSIGAVSTGSYNLRGFRTQWADVDRGTWNFTGNSLNELVGWTNAKGQSFSNVYDRLGRRTSRTEPEGTSNWTWGDTAALHEIGRLRNVSGSGYTDERTYDAAGRLAQTKITTDTPYVFDYTYNSIGALDTLTYPTSPVPSGQSGSRFKIRYDYSSGAPYRIRDVTDTAERTLWTLNTANDFSSPTTETLGTNLVSMTSGYTPWTNELTSVQSGVGGAGNRQNLAYQWDTAGNLTQRQDLTQGLTETFSVDALDRVQSVSGNAAPNLTLAYDASGNLTSKSDVGSYSYHASKKHAVIAAGSHSYGYDANGNVTTRDGLSQTWASFDLPTLQRSGSYQSQLSYGPRHERWKQVATYSNGTETTHYVGGLLEKMAATSTPTLVYWRHYVPTPGGATITVSRNSNSSGSNSGSTTYALTDHLGSSDALLDEAGAYRVRESFDTYGRRRGSNWNAATAPDWAAIGNTTRDGYTGHEMLDSVGTIHMNGRVYDPTVGRFLSVDPLIGDLGDSQSVNPYAYVGNRPLSYIDPSGYSAADGGGGLPGIGYPTNDGSPGSWAWWGGVFENIGDWFDFTSRSLPPPATTIAGQSAQNGVSMCGPGTFSPTCGGTILYAGAPGGDSGVPSSSWITSANSGEGTFDVARAGSDFFHETLNAFPGWYYSGQAVVAAQNEDYLGAIVFYGAAIGDVFLLGRGSATTIAVRVATDEAELAARAGTTVLGKFPDYIRLAGELGAKRFNIPTSVWNRMSAAERWAANQKFLDRAIARGDDILLSNPVRNINDVTGAFRQELDYLIGNGFRLSADGTRLIR